MIAALRRIALCAALACAAQAVHAQDDDVVSRVIVLRHGVRSPTSAPDALAVYANRAWTPWPVAPGVLTDHGSAGMTSLGKRLRQMMIDDRLGHGDCHDAWVVIADSTPRNRDSGAALVKGLMPGCHAGYLALDATQNNPLFHFGEKADKDDDAVTAAPDAWPPQALAELQSILLGCQGDACIADARAQHKKLLLDPSRDDAASRAKAMKAAGSLSENLMLEYAQGFPADRVAWGSGHATAIGRIITLHNLSFALGKKSMPAAAQAGSNLLAHVLATLQRSAGEQGVVAPLAPKGTRVTVLIGHDTNLANLAGLLDVDWHDARQPDDYPPGGALVFDLLRGKHGYALRVASWMPTLEALRQADLAPRDALVIHTLTLAPCPGQDACPLATATPWLQARLDASAIDPAMPALRVNQP